MDDLGDFVSANGAFMVLGCLSPASLRADSRVRDASSLPRAAIPATGFASVVLAICGLAGAKPLGRASCDSSDFAVPVPADDDCGGPPGAGEFTASWPPVWEADLFMKSSVMPVAMMTTHNKASITLGKVIIRRLGSLGEPVRFVFLPIAI